MIIILVVIFCFHQSLVDSIILIIIIIILAIIATVEYFHQSLVDIIILVIIIVHIALLLIDHWVLNLHMAICKTIIPTHNAPFSNTIVDIHIVLRRQLVAQGIRSVVVLGQLGLETLIDQLLDFFQLRRCGTGRRYVSFRRHVPFLIAVVHLNLVIEAQLLSNVVRRVKIASTLILLTLFQQILNLFHLLFRQGGTSATTRKFLRVSLLLLWLVVVVVG
mmetsp:Transcript_9248/g.19962  ORF Transcript_9248/g.19962 Transcript_9248/m.19962 type:complete len:219 (-) Transcript_9248:1458-2114(-)